MIERQFTITIREGLLESNSSKMSPEMQIKRTDTYLGPHEQFSNRTLHTSEGDFLSPQDIKQLLNYLETYLEESWS